MMIYRRYATQHRMWTVGEWRICRDRVEFPEFQRGSVWDTTLRAGLVRALYSGTPVPPIIYTTSPSGRWRIIDGRQRLETLFAWFDGSFTVPGEWFGRPGVELGYDAVSTVIGGGDVESGHRAFNNLVFGGVEYDLETVWDAETRSHVPVADPLRLEAELYLLLNAAKVAHTDADLTAARRIVNGDVAAHQSRQ